MSSSIASTSASTTAAAPSGSSSNLGGTRNTVSGPLASSATQFREIHKNTWLKRLTAEGKKITVGPKKSERSWVVFCVHDDTEALLEGYAEPRQAASHCPEWIVSMQDTLHISHALIPNSHEFEFVVTLCNEVLRFHAMSWEIMQEWVETLRSKLREMKILSPRENLYTKLPEVRAPLLPTRDPTSPLPAPPPVPAALVPGVERHIPQSLLQSEEITLTETNDIITSRRSPTATYNSNNIVNNVVSISASTSISTSTSTSSSTSTPTSPTLVIPSNIATIPNISSMSNTLTQNLLNMLSNPMTVYSEHLNGGATPTSTTTMADNDISLEDLDKSFSSEIDNELSEEFLNKILGKSEEESSDEIITDNSIRVDVELHSDPYTDHLSSLPCELLIPRPHTSSHSKSFNDGEKSLKGSTSNVQKTSRSNVTELEISTSSGIDSQSCTTPIVSCSTATTETVQDKDIKSNITIIQVSTNLELDCEANPPQLPAKNITAEVFKFPETTHIASNKLKQLEYKSNVQIIPSNPNNSTIQVLGDHCSNSSNIIPNADQYAAPSRKLNPATLTTIKTLTQPTILTTTSHLQDHTAVTTVHVIDSGTVGTTEKVNEVSFYGTCYSPSPSISLTPKLPKKIILSANTSGVTNIAVNNITSIPAEDDKIEVIKKMADKLLDDNNVNQNVLNTHYDKVFLSSSIPIESTNPLASTLNIVSTKNCQASTSTTIPTALTVKMPSHSAKITPAPSHTSSDGENKKSITLFNNKMIATTSQQRTRVIGTAINEKPKVKTAIEVDRRILGSPAMRRKRIASPINVCVPGSSIIHPPFLTRGLTEAVITARPSRRDFHLQKRSQANTKAQFGNSKSMSAATTNNNDDSLTVTPNGAIGSTPLLHAAVNRTNSESIEQRRRSSSTSDAHTQRNKTRSTNNNELSSSRIAGNGMRIQQPPQPFRNIENGIGNSIGSSTSPNITSSPGVKRMTLREQQVMQLRREIMHPGGVRLQLRRKDCVGSIAWVDAFGTVWVAGWKQKEHPVLYNALHIGDQLISIAGITISTAAEANKIIRNANTLFVEVLVRRIPFGRGYAIRREREGQCLGLIRDGNSSTIVDVVPNSLAARHGLPPKAQSCDGTSLTFWILTEINGRPLNLFFKENEIRDRLNSVGRDISILVQPSDLIVKLKKQLKSLRSYKDYLVQ